MIVRDFTYCISGFIWCVVVLCTIELVIDNVCTRISRRRLVEMKERGDSLLVGMYETFKRFPVVSI